MDKKEIKKQGSDLMRIKNWIKKNKDAIYLESWVKVFENFLDQNDIHEQNERIVSSIREEIKVQANKWGVEL